jgi:iron-sulfur cluster assembly accessory protein
MDLTITPGAEKFIRRMVRFGGAGENAGFRLSVTPGGCSGLASEFSVEAAPKPGDAEVLIQGLKLFLPAESRLLLQGVIMDFKDTPTQSGLVFQDPKATGCGTCSSSAPGAVPGEASVSISSIPIKIA